MTLWLKSCGKHPLLINQSLNCGAVFILDCHSKLATVFDFPLFSRSTEDDKGFLPYEGVKHDSHSSRSNTSLLTGSHSKPNMVLFKPTIHLFFFHFLNVCSFVSHQQFKEFVEKGLDLMSVAPLERSSLKNILQMVPTHLKTLNAPLERLLREVNDEYLLSMKRASGVSSVHIRTCCSRTDITSINWHCFFKKKISSTVISVEYTFGYSKINDEGESRELPPHRLE